MNSNLRKIFLASIAVTGVVSLLVTLFSVGTGVFSYPLSAMEIYSNLLRTLTEPGGMDMWSGFFDAMTQDNPGAAATGITMAVILLLTPMLATLCGLVIALDILKNKSRRYKLFLITGVLFTASNFALVFVADASLKENFGDSLGMGYGESQQPFCTPGAGIFLASAALILPFFFTIGQGKSRS